MDTYILTTVKVGGTPFRRKVTLTELKIELEKWTADPNAATFIVNTDKTDQS